MLITVPYDSICCTYHQLKYSSSNRAQTNKKDKSYTKETIYLSEHGGLGEKRSGEWAKSRKE